MKKSLLIIFLSLIFVCVSACNSNTSDNTAVSSTKYTDKELQNSDIIETEKPDTDRTETNILPLPKENIEFSFLSGVGAWQTILTLNTDGSFTGWHRDSDMGDSGETYPKGSAYVCSFSGKFGNIEKVDEYSYKMTLTEVETEKAVGEEWIEDGIRYIASEPYGIEKGKDFVFYLPTTPIDKVPQEFLTWCPYRYNQDNNQEDTLSCYGILNVTTNYGFF